jgi:uncharacterized membrane protein YedE/YeeE
MKPERYNSIESQILNLKGVESLQLLTDNHTTDTREELIFWVVFVCVLFIIAAIVILSVAFAKLRETTKNKKYHLYTGSMDKHAMKHTEMMIISGSVLVGVGVVLAIIVLDST